jgi:hypothetical protein
LTTNKIQILLIAGILALTIPSLPLSAHAQPGTVLARFTTPMRTTSPEYFPVGMAFDGQNLWYSDPSDTQPDIFQTTTTGTLLRILPKVVGAAGALAWDGTNLWVASFGPANGQSRYNGRIWQISVGQSPKVLKTIELNDILQADDECAIIDGLGFDASSNTLWFSPDAGCAPHNTSCQVGHVYQIDLSGKLISRLEFPFAISGDTIVGNSLYIVQRCTNPSTVPHIIYKTTLSGQIISGFPLATLVSGHVTTAESIAFDPVTFTSQAHCALWANERTGIVNPTIALTAYEIDCP